MLEVRYKEESVTEIYPQGKQQVIVDVTENGDAVRWVRFRYGTFDKAQPDRYKIDEYT